MRTLIQITLAFLLVGAASTADGQQINAITNGTFQSGSSGWTTFGSFYADGRFSNCHSCPGYAYLSNLDGTGGNNLVGWITQQISIPAGATGASLTFWYSITTTDTSGVPHDVVSVMLIDSATNASTLVHAFDNRNAGSGYSSYSYDLSSFVGKTFKVQFLGSTDGSSPTVFRIDDVAATYTPAPPPPQPPSPPTNLVATGSGSSINLTWNDNANNELAYEVQRASLGGAFAPLSTLGANRTTYTDSIGSYGVIDCYQVRATNTAGVSGYTNQACGTTLAPPNLSFPADGANLTNASVAMSWQSALGATNYIVNVGRTCGGTEIVNGQSTIEVSLSIPVSQGTYVWQVQTRNTNNPGASAFSQCRSFTISTNPAPIANFTWSPQPAKAGQSVSFTNQSSNATSWLWTFGDGSTSALQNPAHTFGAAGSYTVALTATNSIGSNSTTRTVPVIAPPVASFTPSPASPTTGQVVVFTDTSTGAPTSWQWSFGDTGTSSSQNPSHAYSSAGTYTVTLTATNAAGGNTTSRQIQVGTTPTVPVASLTYSPANPQTGQTVSFADTSSGSPTAWQWSFGDGASSTSQNPSHVYVNANTYHVVMSAANVAGANSTAQDLKVVAAPHAPTASFTYSPQSPATGQLVTFTDTSGFAPTSWAWNFGDGGTSAAQNPTHTFASAGTFTVSLTATNSAGTNATNQQITVRSTGSAPTASFTYSPNSPQAGQVITFSDTSSGSPSSWTWTFSDGGTATTATTTHTFTAAGAYSVTLVAANGFGSNSTTQPINVTAIPTKLSAAFTWSPTNPTPTTSISFRDASTGSPTSWLWDFGDNTTSTLQNPTHSFSTVGSYLVTLTAKNGSANNVVTHSILVGVPPKPDFTFQPSTAKAGESVQFVGSASGTVDAWNWDFDDASTSTSQSPTHKFALAGSYVVRLSVTNAFGSLSTSHSVSIQPAACTSCAQLHGRITIGGAPVRANTSLSVRLAGGGSTVRIASDGTYSVDAAQGSYVLNAEVSYPDSISGAGTRIAKIARIVGLSPGDNVADISFASPVIFLHGIQSSSSRWATWADGIATADGSVIVMAPTYDDNAPYEDEAAGVADFLRIQLLQLATTLPSLRVIAHSKGGLVTRVLIGDNPDFDKAIRDVIELGTPNRGTACFSPAAQDSMPRPYHFNLSTADIFAAISSQAKYAAFGSGRTLHAIAGTENLAQEHWLFLNLGGPCIDSCEANDGWVNLTSALTFETPSGSVSIPGFTVPYHHEELGAGITHWILDSIIVPYYQGKEFARCATKGLCETTWCAAGRGLTGVSSDGQAGACSILFFQTSFAKVTWSGPSFTVINDRIPHDVKTERITLTTPPSCSNNNSHTILDNIIGYRVYKAYDSTLTLGLRRVGFVGPRGTEWAPPGFPERFSFLDPDPEPNAYYGVAAVYAGGGESAIQAPTSRHRAVF